MKKLLIGLCVFGSISAFAQTKPNQVCQGMNKFNELVMTELFVGGPANPSHSKATLFVKLNGEVTKFVGMMTSQPDMNGSFLFRDLGLALQYRTAGSLTSPTFDKLNLDLKCTKLLMGRRY